MMISSGRLMALRYALLAKSSRHRSMFEFYRSEKFLPRFKIRAKHTKHTACHHGHIRPVHSSRCHTFVSTFDDDTDPGGLENAVETGGDLGGHFFLDLHSLGINVN